MEIREESYEVYKGLQRPLVFKGFKGKFIYWMAGGVLTSFILSAAVNFFLGAFGAICFGMVSVGSVIFYINKKQKDGIYSKDKTLGIIYLETNYKAKRFEKEQKH